jgi:hypothetical protein
MGMVLRLPASRALWGSSSFERSLGAACQMTLLMLSSPLRIIHRNILQNVICTLKGIANVYG